MKTNNKLREALTRIEKLADDYEQCGTKAGALDTIYELAHAALAEPVKNCDVGTAEEQLKRKRAYCKAQDCRMCPFYGNDSLVCAFRWAQKPYKEGGNK